jgi:hypothetical protein
MTQWHTYVLDWESNCSQFGLKGHDSETSTIILKSPSPRGPLGFVAWQDNQYLQLTPWGHIRWGVLDVPKGQWMEVKYLKIQPQGD